MAVPVCVPLLSLTLMLRLFAKVVAVSALPDKAALIVDGNLILILEPPLKLVATPVLVFDASLIVMSLLTLKLLAAAAVPSAGRNEPTIELL